MPIEFERKRKLPAIEKNISDIIPDKDIRVRILGTIIGVGDNSVIVDDGTGKVEIGFEDLNMIAGLGEGQMVRVITRILPLMEGFACKGEALQNLADFNVNLYKKAKDIINR